jgi:hypothetical protein
MPLARLFWVCCSVALALGLTVPATAAEDAAAPQLFRSGTAPAPSLDLSAAASFIGKPLLEELKAHVQPFPSMNFGPATAHHMRVWLVLEDNQYIPTEMVLWTVADKVRGVRIGYAPEQYLEPDQVAPVFDRLADDSATALGYERTEDERLGLLRRSRNVIQEFFQVQVVFDPGFTLYWQLADLEFDSALAEAEAAAARAHKEMQEYYEEEDWDW